MSKHFAVIGWPLGYSLSPLMHNAFFKKEGSDATYTSVPLTTEELGPWVKTRKFHGYNVTVPHKESIIPFLDELTPSAKAIGAVNTVKNDNDRMIGHNTDAPGFSLMLKEDLRLPMKGLHILILGAGGAAKAIVYEALQAGAASISIYDQDAEKTKRLIQQYATWSDRLHSLSDKETLPDLGQYVDLVINATPIGMKESLGQSVLSLEELQLFRPSTTVVDIIYAPLETQFLKDAKTLGLRCTNGLGMLAGQGILAEQFWFCKSLSYAEAKNILSEAL